MFRPIHILPLFSIEDRSKYQERWNSKTGREIYEYILEKIRKGGGEDFLQNDFWDGKLKIMENQWDLRGFNIFKEEIEFPADENFEGINFSYCQFYHSTFAKAVFESTFSFSRIYNCNFVECIFHYSSFYGAR
ncbi:MAG: hypothetical protein JSW64_05395, partial [Candidatus Zixiibacteriota bacterium]